MEKASRSTAAANSSSSSSSYSAMTSAGTATRFSVESSNNGCGAHSTADGGTSNCIANSLRVLNKSSYKISKPISRNPNPNPNPNLLRPVPPSTSAVGSGSQQQQPQPPVYNIDKNDFRDVVQKLTGSPAHLFNRPPQPRPPFTVVSTSPLPPPPRGSPVPPPLSRLHRIRPPPLAPLSPPASAVSPVVGDGWVRPQLSPLPPFPAVCAAAESPISAYMRRLHSGQTLLAPLPPGAAPQQQLPLSPLSFGCAPSPRTGAAYQAMLSSTLLFPTSPGLPIPSPK